ncbi:MAG TPA: acetyl-CoA C-acyltransferase family protein [Bryobacteraceae bacterium]|nr:acetyl-CoA C-acyltransferase family protein [Bryobacteraceae bacterium]HOQ46295.1 acetyl-CoA C-acyltransferase family protein [Bryobacteraceae bacterium]HPQ14233.1 acetyl-CoA C-acyltransferase family protein [Bryobacteraceae bacterium]HPU72268.1 acetyl-CoA C-acyltransferase family protein [Bryobacteraceae bacterium]
MGTDRDVVVVSAVRTAIGKYGGSLKDKPPSELGAIVIREAVKRAGIEPKEVQHVTMGNVIHTDTRDMYVSRVAAVNAGIPIETPALTVNRVCGSGLQAIVSAAQLIMLGDADVAVAGGVESMSRSQYWIPALRWGQRMSNAAVVDAMVGALSDPFEDVHMGITAEYIAKKFNITRREQDEFAVESNRRAIEAIKHCLFQEQIVPIELKTKTGTTVFDTDEHPRADATLENLAKLKPAFDRNGTVTAGNASGLNDGAAAVVLMERKKAEDRGLKPLARLAGYAFAGVEPRYMGIGPVPAVRNLLKKTGIKLEDVAVIEANEAFAVQALAVMRELGLPPERTNPNGGAVALGHPIGASGAIITVKALHELRRIEGRYAMATLCIGGGQGIAAMFERLPN